MKYLLGIISFAAIILTQFTVIDRVEACSGIGLTIVSLESEFKPDPDQVVVRGVVSNTINSEHGSIIVEEYLVGEPSYNRLQIASTSERQAAIRSRGYSFGSDCRSRYESIPNTHYEYIFFLYQNLDGTYRLGQWLTFEDPSTPPLVMTDTSNGSFEITEAELLTYIDADPQLPIDADMEFPWGPLPNPALIVDELGEAYMIPTDAHFVRDIIHVTSDVIDVEFNGELIIFTRQDTLMLYNRWWASAITRPWPDEVDCSLETCVQFSDDGLLIASRLSPDTFHICEYGVSPMRSSRQDGDFARCRYMDVTQFDGYDFKFSPDSETIAVWHDDQISIHQWGNGVANAFTYDTVSVVASTSIHVLEVLEEQHALSGRSAWSADSRWLAYSDADGLWLWDVFTQAPQLLIPREDGEPIPYARHFSDSGRYLAVSQGDTHTIRDTLSDIVVPDGSIDAEERILLRADTVNGHAVPAEQCNLMTGTCEPLCPNVQGNVTTLVAHWTPTYYSVSNTQRSNTLLCLDGDCGYASCDAMQYPDRLYRHVDGYHPNVWSGIRQYGEYELEFDYSFVNFDLEGTITASIRDIIFLPMPYEELR